VPAVEVSGPAVALLGPIVALSCPAVALPGPAVALSTDAYKKTYWIVDTRWKSLYVLNLWIVTMGLLIWAMIGSAKMEKSVPNLPTVVALMKMALEMRQKNKCKM
jgi:hypothetical protein